MKKIITILILTITVSNIYSQQIDYSKDYSSVYEQLMKAQMYERCVEYFDSLIVDELKEPFMGAGDYYNYAADAKLKLNNIDGAIDYLIKATKDDGGGMGQVAMSLAGYYSSLSSVYSDYKHNYRQAHIAIDSAIAIDYSFIYVENKIKIFDRQNKDKESLAFVNKMINEHPDDVILYKIKSQLLIKQYKYLDAIAVMDIAVAKRKEYNAPNAYYWRAVAKTKAKKYDEAITDFKKCQELETEKGRGYSGLCDIYIELNEYTKALGYIEKAITIEPKDIGYLNRKREIYTAEKKYDLAISTMDKAVNINPQDADAYYWRAVAKKEAKKYDAAIADYQKCIELEQITGRGYAGISDVYKEQKQYEKAHEYIDKAIKLEPKDVNYTSTKSRIYTEQKKYDLAISTMDKAVNINPQDADAYYWRAVAKKEAKKYDAAIADYQKCIELEQITGRGYAGISDVYKEQKQYEKAHKYIDKAIKLEPKDVNYTSTKSRIYTEQKKYDLAISTMDKAVNVNPQDADAYYWRAVAKKEAKKYDAAIADYQKCIELEQITGRGYAGISDVYKKQDKFEDAYEYINKAIEKEPQEISFIYTKAEILKNKGELNNSIKYYMIYEDKEKNGYGYYSISEINFHKGNYIKAETFIDKAIKIDNKNSMFLCLKSLIFCEKENYNGALSLALQAKKLKETSFDESFINVYISIYNVFLDNEDETIEAEKVAKKELCMMIVTASNNTEKLVNNLNELIKDEYNPYSAIYYIYFNTQLSIIENIERYGNFEENKKAMFEAQRAYHQALNFLNNR